MTVITNNFFLQHSTILQAYIVHCILNFAKKASI